MSMHYARGMQEMRGRVPLNIDDVEGKYGNSSPMNNGRSQMKRHGMDINNKISHHYSSNNVFQEPELRLTADNNNIIESGGKPLAPYEQQSLKNDMRDVLELVRNRNPNGQYNPD